jgi:hypothetical protein
MCIVSGCLFAEARKEFHATLLDQILSTEKGIPSNADRHSRSSCRIAEKIAGQIGEVTRTERLAGQMSGSQFEQICLSFIAATFPLLSNLRPGKWSIRHIGGRNRLAIADFAQYKHLSALNDAAKNNPELAAALGSDYTITPDIVIGRQPEDDEVINTPQVLVCEDITRHSDLRRRFKDREIMHASISCKWTIRSDRVQNSRSEALNLVRNRKGGLPRIMVVTGEPLPSRLAAIALGTGDIDCVYHFALPELQRAVDELDDDVSKDLVDTMVNGDRLRDISDLPLDLAI